MAERRILVVEDTPELGAQIRDTLERAEFAVTWLRDGLEALRENPSHYDLVVLDLMLPGAYGLDILKRYREHADTPVIILSARRDTTDKVRGLELGADDYMTKPFWPEELVARVNSRLRRPVMQRGNLLRHGPIELDSGAHIARVDGRNLDLTGAEFAFFAALVARPGEALTRSQLADSVLDPERDGMQRTLDNHVSRLRKKLGEHGSCIQTVWGIGYRFEPPES